MIKYLLPLILMASCVNAEVQIFKGIDLKIDIYDFFGECNGSAVDNGDALEGLKCTSNFLNPSLENPLNIFKPYNDKVINSILLKNECDGFDTLCYAETFFNLLTVPFTSFIATLEVIFNVFKYFLVFFFKFMFVYLFYVSLGFQSLLNLISDQKLEHPDRVMVTFTLIGFFTIFTLGGGLWDYLF